MVQAIRELQEAGIEPAVREIEGLDRRRDWEEVVAAARSGGRDRVGSIIPVRGEHVRKVSEGPATAAAVEGFLGFAAGRTVSWDPLINHRAKQTAREAAVAEMAGRYGKFVAAFGKARPSRPGRGSWRERLEDGPGRVV